MLKIPAVVSLVPLVFGGGSLAAVEIHVLQAESAAETRAHGINDLGQVVGEILAPNGAPQPMIWNDFQATPLPLLPGGRYGEALRINRLGQVVGLAGTTNDNRHAVYWDAAGVVDIGTLGGPTSFANDINDHGVVVGSSDTGQLNSNAFVWTKAGGLVDYGNLNPTYRFANAGFNGINYTGKLVGTAYDLFSPFRSVVGSLNDSDKGVLTDISVPGRSNSAAAAVNDAGVVVGFSNHGSGDGHAALFDEHGGFTDLGDLGLGESFATDVSDTGDIVGYAVGIRDGFVEQRAFLYRDQRLIDLTELLPKESGWDALYRAEGVNNRGQIVGIGSYLGKNRAYVLTIDVPEPTALGLAAAALFAVSRRRR